MRGGRPAAIATGTRGDAIGDARGELALEDNGLRGEPEAGGASTSLPGASPATPGFAGVAGGCPAPSLGSAAAADVSPSSGEDILAKLPLIPTVHFTSTFVYRSPNL